MGRRLRLWLSVGVVVLLAGCGGETVGSAAERWCHQHYSISDAAEDRCLMVIVTRKNPSRFLHLLEFKDQTDIEIAALRAQRP